MNIRPIKSEKDHAQAMRELTALLESNPPENSADADRLEILSTLIEKYESNHFPIEDPTPVEAIQFRMEQMGLNRKDLVPYIGSASKVSEVLNGKRPLSITMIRSLHRELGIPADVLISDSDRTSVKDRFSIASLPVKQMWKSGYFGRRRSWDYVKNNCEALISSLVTKAKIDEAALVFCRSTANHIDKKILDTNALKLWRSHVIITSLKRRVAKYRHGIVDKKFLEDVAQLSVLKSGPVLARELLENVGIPIIIEEHLSHTYLDGAAFLRSDGVPVIGLTLRHDRLDNFWFTLMHELVHVGWHLSEERSAFFDDNLESESSDAKEKEADSIAAESLVPKSKLEEHNVDKWESVVSLSRDIRRHPVVIAGRIHHETGNYKTFAKKVARFKVKSQFKQLKDQ
jgi:HTH-type transcriptional regulator / antitoxin HigA